jgi:hypothetical protein
MDPDKMAAYTSEECIISSKPSQLFFATESFAAELFN